MGILKSFDIKRLRPFRKAGDLPGTSPDEEEKIAKLDRDLQPEEQAYVRHYIDYADVLLNKNLEEEGFESESGRNLVEMPRQVANKKAAEKNDRAA